MKFPGLHDNQFCCIVYSTSVRLCQLIHACVLTARRWPQDPDAFLWPPVPWIFKADTSKTQYCLLWALGHTTFPSTAGPPCMLFPLLECSLLPCLNSFSSLRSEMLMSQEMAHSQKSPPKDQIFLLYVLMEHLTPFLKGHLSMLYLLLEVKSGCSSIRTSGVASEFCSPFSLQC